MRTERQEELIRSLDFTITVSIGEAKIREDLASKVQGVYVERLENECPEGKVVISLAAERPEALSEFNLKVIPMLVEKGIWHKDTLRGRKIKKTE